MAASNLTTLLETAVSKPDNVAALDVVKVLIPDVPGSYLSLRSHFDCSAAESLIRASQSLKSNSQAMMLS